MAIAKFLGALPVGNGLPISQIGASYNQLIYTSPLLGGDFTFKGTSLDTGAGQLSSGFLKVAGSFFLDVTNINLPQMGLLQATQQGGELFDALSYVLKGNDTISGNHVTGQVLRGYDGNDTYIVDRENVDIEEEAGGGTDTAIVSLCDHFSLTYELENMVIGEGTRGAQGNRAANTVWLNAAGVSVFTAEGNDTVHGSSGADNVGGGNGIDSLFGNGGSDYLWGDEGNDKLYGDAGRDGLVGGKGRDLLTGGGGYDNFQYKHSTDSGLVGSSRDLILDFVAGTAREHEVIRLDGLMHNGTPVQWYPWEFKGTARFDTSGVPQIRYMYQPNTDQTIIQISLDRDTDAEMSIALVGMHTLHEYNFYVR